MDESFSNVYDDGTRAEAYAGLELPGTYWLAYRDLPELLRAHVQGKRALDFGCGAGRSTRFLRELGFDPIGVDISAEMLQRAQQRDPDGTYLLVDERGPTGLEQDSFDLVLAAFTFDNVPGEQQKVSLFRVLRDLLNDGGRLVCVVSSPEIYVHEWASFSTKDFPANREAQSGDIVRIVMLDVEDRRPVEDVLWTDAAYHAVYQRAGLTVLETRRPLGRADEPYPWVSETSIAPWTVYVLGKR